MDELKHQYDFVENGEIGRGFQGVVNLAIDKNNGYPVAIKSLFSALLDKDPEMLEKFKIEANIYLHLKHSNIVKLKDFVILKRAHLVMEYIDGKCLDEYINQVTGPITTEVAVSMMKKIVSAIGYAHKKKIPIKGYDGVLHLDIKPGNILLTNNGEVKVIDYGISQGTEQERGKKMMGSPMYMSPEQLDLKQKLTAKSDIYALGVLLFQMVTGKTPYPKEWSQQEVFDAIKTKPLDRIVEIYPFSDNRIQKIIDKATQKKPSERYFDCDDFISDLNKIV